MKTEKIHIHKSRDLLVLTLVPSLVFVLVLFFFTYVASSPQQRNEFTAASTEASTTARNPTGFVEINELRIPVEIANTASSRAQGLSGRAYLPEEAGMLFAFDTTNVFQTFWMKDMLIPLDIIWIKDGKVAQIHENAQPEPGVAMQNLTLYVPAQRIDYVLEVNAGFAAQHNIQVGDAVTLPAF